MYLYLVLYRYSHIDQGCQTVPVACGGGAARNLGADLPSKSRVGSPPAMCVGWVGVENGENCLR